MPEVNEPNTTDLALKSKHGDVRRHMTCDSLQEPMDRELVWLFVRGDESVRISRPVAARVVFVCGPGRKVDRRKDQEPLPPGGDRRR